MEDLPLGRIAALVPEFAVKFLPLGRTLMLMMIYNIYTKFYSLSTLSLGRFITHFTGDSSGPRGQAGHEKMKKNLHLSSARDDTRAVQSVAA